MKKISKLMLITCVIAGSFYYALPTGRQATVFAALPIVANAGPDKYFSAATNGNNVVAALQGSSTNPNNSTIAYSWSCNGGSLSNSNIANPNFTVPYTAQNVSYNCILRATDNYAMSDTDDVVIYLNNTVLSNSIIATIPASNISNAQATLRGSFNADNANYLVWFQWGTTVAYGIETNRQIVLDSSDWSFKQKIESLAPNTQYHFRAVAQKQSNKQLYYGENITFYTGSGVPNVILPPDSQNLPTTVPTGITDDFFKDSFFFPLLVLVAVSWIVILRYKRSKEY